MSTCHTVRFRIQRSKHPQARSAIDAYLSALAAEGQDARLHLMAQVPRSDGELEFIQLNLCDVGSGCVCDDPSPATRTFRDAIGAALACPPVRDDYRVIHEGHPD